VSAFSISAAGGLTAVAGSPFALSSRPRTVQIEPSGKFAYVPTLSANEVEVFSIAATGALSLAGKVRTRPQAAAIAFSVGTAAVTYTPKFAYVANYDSSDVSGYTVDPSSGALAAAPGSPFAGGSGVIGVATDASGKFAYVVNNNSGSISAFTISASSGALTPVAGSPFAAGTAPFAGTLDPTGRFLYISN